MLDWITANPQEAVALAGILVGPLIIAFSKNLFPHREDRPRGQEVSPEMRAALADLSANVRLVLHQQSAMSADVQRLAMEISDLRRHYREGGRDGGRSS